MAKQLAEQFRGLQGALEKLNLATVRHLGSSHEKTVKEREAFFDALKDCTVELGTNFGLSEVLKRALPEGYFKITTNADSGAITITQIQLATFPSLKNTGVFLTSNGIEHHEELRKQITISAKQMQEIASFISTYQDARAEDKERLIREREELLEQREMQTANYKGDMRTIKQAVEALGGWVDQIRAEASKDGQALG